MAKRRDYKVLRIILQLLFLAGIGWWLAHVLISRGFPDAPDRDVWSQRDGFIAVSFGGLGHDDSGPLLSRHDFRRQLEALKNAGYVSISTGDVAAFYEKDAPLPERAVYLMFEGGRKDSAIFGQETLSAVGYRATMFFPTAQFGMFTRTFMSFSEAGSLASNPFWEVGSMGHEIYLKDARVQDYRTYYLTDYRRDSSGEIVETPGQYTLRAGKDLGESRDLLDKLAGYPPAAYIFMPANSLGNSLDPELDAINTALVDRYYRLAFTREGSAYNSRLEPPRRLSRMLVRKGTGDEELLAKLEMWLPNFRPYVFRADSPANRWFAEHGELELRESGLALASNTRQDAFAWLIGSDNWRDLDLSLVLPDAGMAFASVYIRYVSREHFLRLRREGDVLLIQERLPGRGLRTLLSLPLSRGPARTRLTVKDNRAWLAVNSRNLTPDPLPLDRGLTGGKLALGLDGDVAGAPPCLFQEISVNPIREYWRNASGDEMDDGFGAWPENLATTGLVINAGNAADGRDRDISRLLLQAAASGVEVYARLPVVSPVGLNVPGNRASALPAELQNALWAGIVVGQPDPIDWATMDAIAKRAAERGWKTVAELTSPQAARLASLKEPPPFSGLLLSWKADIPRQTLAALQRRYARIFFRDGEGWNAE